MRLVVAIRFVPAALAAFGVAVLTAWLNSGPMMHIRPRVPGADRPPAEAQLRTVPAPKLGTLVNSDGLPAADMPGAWPRFRGENSDGVSRDDTPPPLAREWPPDGPRELWSVEMGEGYAGAAVLKGRVYVLDYDREKQADALRCLSFADGREIWRYSYPVKVKRYHGMSRTVPAVTEDYVVALGPKCHVTCLDSETGAFLWGMDLTREFGTKVPPWYAGQCPLIDDGRAVIAPGGEALMMAVDCKTGETAWRTPNPHGWAMTHSSVIPMEFKGRRMYVYCASRGVVGVSAEDGRILWETDAWRISIATIPSPVPVGGGRIFFSGGYNSGSMMVQLREKDGRLVAEPVFRLKPKVFGAEQHTPVFYGGHIYGVRPNGELVCLDLQGGVLWASGREDRFGKGLGPWLIADGMIYVMDGEGVLSLVEARPDGFRRLARAKVLDGHDSWGPMAMAGGRLIVRDVTRMVCLDVGRR